ncbi:hypothetical protein BBK36DRAFT_1117698 [Trichoderma citrinoviride]|uniref:Uncharacterized protein n=1 Tax=Trichoderma citrinoviride TaxID=58853 RepID=A0A2T4BCA2_9HYPO|nr:hypothetical protein BBK36DRAFT_1117698 [Trichoderma citrinoviride]PTB66962.1 hypothetical protein BBK36DRAFT_1117698 [Trichoderma citrinoviride]
MPLAPTPLSGCPLHRLEIRDGSTGTVYDATQLESSLTATLEARRSLSGGTNKSDLMLQSHLGLSRVLSIQLADLLTSSGDTTEVVTVDKPSQQMCIRIHEKKQTILFTFKESRDFNVAIYTLKRFGFRVRDSVFSFNHTTAGLARSQSSAPSSNDLGPRLSSITPLQGYGSSQAPSPFSFTALLNSDVPLSQIQSMGTQHEPYESPSPDSSQQLIRHIVPATYAHQNPYQLYLGQHGNLYQPRVSSPLRNAVEVDSRDLSPMSPVSPMPQSQPSLSVHPTTVRSLLAQRSTSAPITTPPSWQQPRYMNTDGCGSPYYQQSPPGSQETTITSTESDSQSTDGTNVTLPLQIAEDFRKLMPQPRNLPFLKEGKTKTAVLKPVKRRAKTELGPSSAKRKNSFFAGHGNSNTSNDGAVSCVQENGANSDIDDASAAPITLHPTSFQTRVSQNGATSPDHSSLEICDLPPMLIADSSLLEKVNNSTSRALANMSSVFAQVESLLAMRDLNSTEPQFVLPDALFFRLIVDEVAGPFIIVNEVAWCHGYYMAWKLMIPKNQEPDWPHEVPSDLLVEAADVLDLAACELYAYQSGYRSNQRVTVYTDTLERVAWCVRECVGMRWIYRW